MARIFIVRVSIQGNAFKSANPYLAHRRDFKDAWAWSERCHNSQAKDEKDQSETSEEALHEGQRSRSRCLHVGSPTHCEYAVEPL